MPTITSYQQRKPPLTTLLDKAVVGFIAGLLIAFMLLPAANAQSLLYSDDRSNLNRAAISIGFMPEINFNESSVFYSADESYGVFFGIQSSKVLGVGGSWFNTDFKDKIDNTIVFNHQFRFIDIYFNLPVPNIIQLLVGVGAGQTVFDCTSDSCFVLHRNLSIEKVGGLASHVFLLAGIWVGKIYNLQLGYHQVSGPTIELSDRSFVGKRTIPRTASALSIGGTVLF